MNNFVRAGRIRTAPTVSTGTNEQFFQLVVDIGSSRDGQMDNDRIAGSAKNVAGKVEGAFGDAVGDRSTTGFWFSLAS